MAEGKPGFDDLDCLTERCQAAPRHGKNAKALLLEAVEHIGEEFEFRETAGYVETAQSSAAGPDSPTIPRQQQKTDAPSLVTDVHELFRCIPPEERIYIPYSVTQKVPKITRQTEVNTLMGKYLQLLLRRTSLTSKEAWLEEVKRNESLRMAATRAADKNERLIYRECYRAADYLKRIKAEKASEKFVDVWWLQEHQQELGLGRSGSHSSSNDVVQVKQSHNPRDAAESCNTSDRPDSPIPSDLSTCNEMTQHTFEEKEATSKNCQPKLEVKHQEVDEVSVQESSSANESKVTKPNQQPKKGAQSVCQEPAAKAEVDDNSVKEKSEGTSAKTDHEKHKKPSDKESTVLAFVKRDLDPLFAAKLINREIYKAIAKKVVQKVLAVHSEDQNADFLIDESEKVKRLTRSYVKYYRKQSSKASSS